MSNGDALLTICELCILCCECCCSIIPTICEAIRKNDNPRSEVVLQQPQIQNQSYTNRPVYLSPQAQYAVEPALFPPLPSAPLYDEQRLPLNTAATTGIPSSEFLPPPSYEEAVGINSKYPLNKAKPNS